MVTVGRGPYPLIDIQGKKFDPPVTINAGTTVVNGLRIWNSSGIIWRGGVIKSPAGRDGHGPTVYGANVRKSDKLTFDGTRFTESLRGAVIADSTNLVVRNSHFTNLRSDGLNVAGNNHMLLENNRFDKITPVKATGSKADKIWKDGDHPDAIQIWNTPNTHFGTDIGVQMRRLQRPQQPHQRPSGQPVQDQYPLCRFEGRAVRQRHARDAGA